MYLHHWSVGTAAHDDSVYFSWWWLIHDTIRKELRYFICCKVFRTDLHFLPKCGFYPMLIKDFTFVRLFGSLFWWHICDILSVYFYAKFYWGYTDWIDSSSLFLPYFYWAFSGILGHRGVLFHHCLILISKPVTLWW